MPNRILPNPLRVADAEQLRQAHPAYNIAEIDKRLSALPAPSQFSQTRAAEEALSLARRMRESFPHISATKIGAAVRAGYQGPQKLTGFFDREIGRLLNEQPVKPDKRRRKPSRPGDGAVATEAAPTTSVSVLRNAPSVEDMAALLPNRAPAASAVEAQRQNHQQKSDQPVEDDDRPYRYDGKFVGFVYRTGFGCVGKFYDAIRAHEDMAVVRDSARAIIATNGAEAAMAAFHDDDRAIFTAVARSLGDGS